MSALSFISTFTGIGGFDAGFESAGMECVGQCEIDRWANMVLRYRWPEVERINDVKEINGSTINVRPNVICGGFPCQDLSVAGKRAGLAGKRSGLFFEFERIIVEFEPALFVIENVPGLLSSNEKRDFASILRRLGQCGYLQAWRVLDSQYFGMAQRRRRVYIVGSLGSGSCAEILFESKSLSRDPAESRKAGERVADSLTVGANQYSGFNGEPVENCAFQNTGHGWWKESGKATTIRTPNGGGSLEANVVIPNIARTLSARNDGSPCIDRGPEVIVFQSNMNNPQTDKNICPTIKVGSSCGIKSPQAVCFESRYVRNGRGAPNSIVPPLKAESGKTNKGDASPIAVGSFGVRRLTPRECERLQGFPDDWTRWGINENGDKVEISDTQRYKMLGNAVTVSVAEWIGRRIIKVA